MQHTTTVIETKVLSDAAIAVLCRCCDDQTTDSWHTIYVTPSTTEAELDQEITAHVSRVHARHEARGKAEAFLRSKMAGKSERTANTPPPAAH